MFYWEEMALVEGLIQYYKEQAQAYPGEDGLSDGTLLQGNPSGGEGTSFRVQQGKVSDGTAKPYYPSASKGDVMATGEELQTLFGIQYVDERN